MNKLLVLILMASWMMIPPAVAASDTAAKIERIQQERQRLAHVKKKLEKQLGTIGKDMRKLDAALIKARRASRQAHANVLATDKQLVALQRESKKLAKRINELKQAMLDQAAAAWRRSSRSSQWMGVLTGVSVSDIPHRRFLLHEMMRSEQEDRRVYAASVAEMADLEVALQAQRVQLDQFRQQKKQAEVALSARVQDKRKMIDRVRQEVKRKSSKDSRLAREERALLRLLNDMSRDLLSIDRQQLSQKSVRKRKGRLKWPVSGRIVASFNSKPKATMARIKGVQLRPKKNIKEIKAMSAGQVRYADWFGGYGLMIIVDYGEGLLGVYAHNDALYKQLGDWLEEGEIIADAGSTGWVSKVTLYFEIRDRGKAVNPKYWCRR